ncbi:MAG: ribosomal protection-like ABC-F family protein [Anaerolineaceae bacterium]
MLTAHHLSKSYDLQTLFENVTFSINPGDRIGLVGTNGCGKTTLLRILAGVEQTNTGSIYREASLRIGYLPQGFEPEKNTTIADIIGKAIGSISVMETRLAELSAGLAQDPHDPKLGREYDDLLQQIQNADPGRVAAILSGLGLPDLDQNMPAAYLSGGQKTRLSLALVLLVDPQILLLDEPTNHLDITMLEWLEKWLRGLSSGVLIVSHDRTFLDNTVTHILEMDMLQKRVKEYAGNYSDYLAQRQNEQEKQAAEFNDQRMRIRQMKQDIAAAKNQAAYTERQASSVRIGGPEMKIKGAKDYHHAMAKKVAKKAKAREKRLEHYLESEERVERPVLAPKVRFGFGKVSHLGQSVLELEDLNVGYRAEKPLLSHLRLQVQSGKRIVLTGPNGAGKTTLLRTIAGEISPLAGQVSLGSSVRMGMMEQDQSSLDPSLSAVDTIIFAYPNETQARSYLSSFLFLGDEPLKLVKYLSYGQKARLLLAKLIAEGCNFLLLDEPINHLDIPSRMQFETALSQFQGTVLAVVHDRYFIERFADEVWWVKEGGVQVEYRLASIAAIK